MTNLFTKDSFLIKQKALFLENNIDCDYNIDKNYFIIKYLDINIFFIYDNLIPSNSCKMFINFRNRNNKIIFEEINDFNFKYIIKHDNGSENYINACKLQNIFINDWSPSINFIDLFYKYKHVIEFANTI